MRLSSYPFVAGVTLHCLYSNTCGAAPACSSTAAAGCHETRDATLLEAEDLLTSSPLRSYGQARFQAEQAIEQRQVMADDGRHSVIVIGGGLAGL